MSDEQFESMKACIYAAVNGSMGSLNHEINRLRALLVQPTTDNGMALGDAPNKMNYNGPTEFVLENLYYEINGKKYPCYDPEKSFLVPLELSDEEKIEIDAEYDKQMCPATKGYHTAFKQVFAKTH